MLLTTFIITVILGVPVGYVWCWVINRGWKVIVPVLVVCLSLWLIVVGYSFKIGHWDNPVNILESGSSSLGWGIGSVIGSVIYFKRHR